MSIFGPLKIFYCYAREDKKLRDQLAKHLEPLRRSKKIITWYDREISPGKDYEEEIISHLNTSDIVLALVSKDFFASNYCQEVEMHRALERHIIGDTRVVPILLRDTIWRETFLGKLQALPENGRPLVTWRPIESGFVSIVAGIQRVIEEIEKDNGTITDSDSADKYLKKAFALEEIGYYQEAAVAYKQALRLNPNNFHIWWYFFCLLAVNLKKYREALIVCEKLSYRSTRYQDIFHMENKFDAVNMIGEYISIYEGKIKVLDSLRLFDELDMAVRDLDHIKKDEEYMFEMWMEEKRALNASDANVS